MGARMKTAIALVIGLAAVPLWALVFAILWRWFVVPLGVPTIGAAHAFGLALVYRALKFDIPVVRNEGKSGVMEIAVPLFLALLVLLAAGFVAHSIARLP